MSTLEALKAPGGMVPFTLDLILLELDGGCYVVPILLGDLTDLLVGIRGVS